MTLSGTQLEQEEAIRRGWQEYGSLANPIVVDDEYPVGIHWSQLFNVPNWNELVVADGPTSFDSADRNPNGDASLRETIKARYRINCRNIFLTYPRCLLLKEFLLEHLKDLFKSKVQYIVVAKEEHEDGFPHLHALVCLNKKVDIRKQDYFDVQGFHPNIQSVKHLGKVKNYVCKDKDIVEFGEFKMSKTGPNKSIPEWEEGMSRLDYLTACWNSDIPYGYAAAFYSCIMDPMANVTLSSYDDSVSIPSDFLVSLTPLFTPLNSLGASGLPTASRVLDAGNFFSIVIVGPAGCGKTLWTKKHCPKPALWVTHLDDLKLFAKGFHQSIVFDDMCFTYLPVQAQISIVDRYDDRSIHCRYNVAKIPAYIPKFFTCNDMPFTMTEAVKRRLILVECIDPRKGIWEIIKP